ncbi:hypothetical protein NVP1121O_076 [Vibrio phage 1.121.O._10N.286.46.C4]|nr:hypothetical protein NVP1121O_076 [Vibrio phage 1.121.O._10N.286.46.C4]
MENLLYALDTLLCEVDDWVQTITNKNSDMYGYKRIHIRDLSPIANCKALAEYDFSWYTFDVSSGWFTSKTKRLTD